MPAPPPHRTNLKAIPSRAMCVYTKRFNKATLSEFRLRGDPVADAVANALHRRGGLTNIHDLLGTVRDLASTAAAPGTADDSGDGAAQICRDFLAEAASVPPWVDRAKVARAQRVHAVQTPFMGLSLFSGSLVGGAQFRTAAVVTTAAGNLANDPTRRIRETGLLLAALAFPGSLVDAGGEAHDSLTRVRLLHAALRHWLPRSGRLPPAQHRRLVPDGMYVEGEVFLNQHDLALTLGIFCYLNLRSLRLMGVVLPSGDVEAYVHMWRVVGHVLGIVPELCPATLEEQEELMLASMRFQGAPAAIGSSIKGFVRPFAAQVAKGTRGWVGEETAQEFLLQLTVYLNGAEHMSGAGIEDKGRHHWAPRLVRLLGGASTAVARFLPFGETLLFWLHTSRIRHMLDTEARRRGGDVAATGHAPGSGGAGASQPGREVKKAVMRRQGTVEMAARL